MLLRSGEHTLLVFLLLEMFQFSQTWGKYGKRRKGEPAPNTAKSDHMFSVDRHAAVDCCSRCPSSRVVFRPLRDDRTVKTWPQELFSKSALPLSEKLFLQMEVGERTRKFPFSEQQAQANLNGVENQVKMQLEQQNHFSNGCARASNAHEKQRGVFASTTKSSSTKIGGRTAASRNSSTA